MGKHVIHGEEVIPGESGGKNRWKKTRRGKGETRPRYNLARIEILCCFCAFVVNVCAKRRNVRPIGKKLTKNSTCVFFFFLAPSGQKISYLENFSFLPPKPFKFTIERPVSSKRMRVMIFRAFFPSTGPQVQMKQLNKLAGFAFRYTHFANPSPLAHLPEHA